MASLTDRSSFLLAVILYGISAIYAIFVFRRGFRRDSWINYLLLLGGFVLHTLTMTTRGSLLNRCPINNLYEATVFITWTMVAVSLAIGAWPRFRFISAFASPVLFGIGVFALMPALDAKGPAPVFSGGWSELHKALILLSFGAFGLSAVAAIMYILQDRNLKVNKARAVRSLLPPVQRLEAATSRLLVAGFVFLTAGLVTSALYMKQARNVYVSGDAYVVYSAFVWFLYLSLVLMRWCFAQRGRRFALGAIGGFAFVILTFWGVYLLSGLHNP